MSVEHMAVVLNHSQATGTAKVLLLGIANHAGDGGAWPSIRTLTRYAGVDDRNVRRALRTLEELGELHISVQHGGGERMPDYRRPNRYEVLVRCPSWCDRSAQHRDVRTSDTDLWDGNSTPWRKRPPPPGASAPRPPGVNAPRPLAPAPPEPSREPPEEPRLELSGSGIHSSHGLYGAEPDELYPPGVTDPLDFGRNE
ncbi:hypothetical protein JOE61_003847 [Nocardioides salarius]|uniref:Helix-turn-helix domain-containing protein n=1 Tax=Nocardioides salarius TaxID=374513 RepID=A0ABS2MFS3_9ACTN|nr:helix-turn-helix domain-containing protein [Nocardioides salarius]MBM7510033.1 hypothetical protein [Nocardioides salarius]